MEAYLREHIYHLEKLLLQPEIRKSIEDLANLLAEDFVEIGSSGRTYNKQQVLEVLPQASVLPMTLKDFNSKILAPDVVLNTFYIDQYSESTKETKSTVRSSIWKLIDGRWQIVFHQGTFQRVG